MQSKLTRQQTKQFRKDYKVNGRPETLIVNVRYDDQCGNGHNTFAITADLFTQDRQPGEKTITHESGAKLWLNSCGCLHDDIAKWFPELAPLIKWHLCSSDGPLHYIANTMYMAGDKDCNGRRKGEPSSWEYGIRFNDVPVTHTVKRKFFEFLKERHGTGEFAVVGFEHAREPKTYGTHYTFVGFGETWYDCPFRSKVEALEFCDAMNRCKVEFCTIETDFSAGKERELNSARNAAIWPDATNEELTAPDLKARLEARIPGLLEEFRAAVESLNFVW